MDTDTKVSPIEYLKQFVRSPLVIIGCALAGVFCGIFCPQVATHTNFIGDIYLNFLGLISVPFLFSALSSSLGTLLQSRSQRTSQLSIGKMFFGMFFGLVFIGALFFGIGSLSVRFYPSSVKVEQLDAMLSKDTSGLDEKVISYYQAPTKKIAQDVSRTVEFSFSEFFRKSIPTNIFQSLIENNILHILIFTILFGIALGLMPEQRTQSTFSILGVIYNACMTFVEWSTYFMPICVFSLLTKAVSVMDGEVIRMTSSLLATYLLSMVVLTVIFIWLWSRAVGVSFGRFLRDEGRILLLAFCTCQRLVVLPMLIRDLKEKYRLPEKELNIVMPFSFTVGRVSTIAPYLFMTAVVAHLYGVGISCWVLIFICFLTPFIGVGGVFPLSVAVLMDILNLPGELALLLLCSVMPIDEPFATLYNVAFSSCFSSWLLCKKKGTE